MFKVITHNDITITRAQHGGWNVSAIVNGYLVGRYYMDYTKRESQQMFYNEVNKQSGEVNNV